MHKHLVFDLDGTLAPIGGPVSDKALNLINELQKMGYSFAICSGKSADYITGLLRQAQIKNAVIISENGSNICYGFALPPAKYIEIECSELELFQITNINTILHKTFGPDIFHQPNRIVLNPFPLKEETFDKMAKIFEANKDDMTELILNRHVDCYDILPKSINKQAGLKRYALEENASPSDFICVGDSVNDIPMFEFADIAIGVSPAIADHVDYMFNSLEDVLTFIKENNL